MATLVAVEKEPTVVRRDQEIFVVDREDSPDKRSLSELKRKVLRLILSKDPDLYHFIRTSLDWQNIDEFETRIVQDASETNLDQIDHISQSLLIARHRFNDVRQVNKYFNQVHKRLKLGGYFVGRGETLEVTQNRFRRQYGVFARIVNLCHFCYARILPKLRFSRKLYFLLSKGKNRAFPKAEILGRLYYCGFEVKSVQQIDNDFFYLARKVKEPVGKAAPSCGLVIKLKRIGRNGNCFNVYKLRTMHAYSEYLQEYIYKQHNLSDSGKFREDFRVTKWGQFLRKYWLDELPQIVNFCRGDIGLVGARALSEHYFSLYPTSLQEMRNQFKPGLIPPYYVDLPSSFTEILASEQRYFERKSQSIMTDNIYFAKAVYNILVKRARSL